jgi:hypothetical protein
MKNKIIPCLFAPNITREQQQRRRTFQFMDISIFCHEIKPPQTNIIPTSSKINLSANEAKNNRRR